MKQKFSSNTPWESIVGYSRVVRAGALVELTGTVSMDGDRLVGKGDVAKQTRFILDKIRVYLEKAGASMEDVIRTRIYVTDISQWETIGRVHGEYFGEIRPATTMVEVSALIHPDFLVEIEASAYVGP